MRIVWLATLALVVTACGASNGAANASPPSAEALELRSLAAEVLARPEIDIDRVTVQHCLIMVSNSGPQHDKPVLSYRDAEERAAMLLKKARGGADFRAMVLENSYDNITSADSPGVYLVIRPQDMKVPPPERPKLDQAKGEFYRDEMVHGFSMVAWRLKVGEFGVTEKSKEDSPFGFHIIKRLK